MNGQEKERSLRLEMSESYLFSFVTVADGEVEWDSIVNCTVVSLSLYRDWII